MRLPLLKLAAVLLPAMAMTNAAFAAPNCTAAPKAKWMPASEMQARVAQLGYKVKVFKIAGNCYEIYGWTKDGKKAEVYFNPVSGEIVKSKIKS